VTKSSPRRARWRAWRGPLLAGALSTVALLAGFTLLLPRLPPSERSRAAQAPRPEDVFERLSAGQQALAEGKFRLARQLLNEAVAARDRQPDRLSPAEHRNLNQLQRQADLLARLCHRSLEEILRQAAVVRDPEEWDAQFSDYRGRTVLFDDVVVRDTTGRPALAFYVVQVNDETARVALEDLTLLRDLPLDPPARLLLGARLARCGREQGGAWVVRFEPDSCVLLTDPGATSACCPDPLSGQLSRVLRRQERWLRDVAGLRPAAP
jgi:hypothetical protein